MATRVELPLETVREALKTKLQSTNRAINTSGNTLIKEILQKEAGALQIAVNTLNEVK